MMASHQYSSLPLWLRNVRLLEKQKRMVREIYQYFWLYLGLLYVGITGVACTIVGSVLYPLLPRKSGLWLGRWLIGSVFRSLLFILRIGGVLKLDLSALDQLRKDKGIIIAANHPSILDAVLIISRVPDVVCIMKADIWDSIVLGGALARLARYIRNDSPRKMIRRSTEELRSGQRLLVFPEGTRTRRKPVNAFKGGFALIAKKSEAPIQTVFIESNSDFLCKGWPLFKKPPMPLVYRARLGRRVQNFGETRSFIDELEQYYRHNLGAESVTNTSLKNNKSVIGQATTTLQ